MFQTIIIVISL